MYLIFSLGNILKYITPPGYWVLPRASNEGFRTLREDLTITEKAPPPSRAFSWLKAPTSGFTFETLLRHIAKQELTLSK